MRQILLTILLLCALSLPLAAAETLYPSGYNLISDYNLSTQTIGPGDTLVITRTIINNESFPLTGLYFSENVPAEFELVDHAIARNGDAVACQFSSIDNLVQAGKVNLNWLVDDPAGSVNNTLAAGDELVLTAHFTCASEGSYSFSMHSSVFYGAMTGFYSTDDAITITVTTSDDVTPPNRIIDLRAEE